MNEKELILLALEKYTIPKNTKGITKETLAEGLVNFKGTELTTFLGYKADSSVSEFMKKLLVDRPKGTRTEYKTFLLSSVDVKECSVCGELLPLSSFNKRSDRLIGLLSHCRNCQTAKRSEVLGTEEYKEYHKKYRIINSDKISEYQKDYASTNKDKIASRKHSYYLDNSKHILLRCKLYRENNPGAYRAYNAKRRAAKLQATPKWADQEKIRRIYNECPEGYHVDHIVPIRGKLVCGLHCEFNLQHLTAAENLAKSNKFTPC